MDAPINRGDASMESAPEARPADSGWKLLYRVGGAAALISAVFIPIQVIVFIVWPPPIDTQPRLMCWEG